MRDITTTFVLPGYRRTSAGHKPIDGVQFYSYVFGILRYCRISEDGQIITISARSHSSTYTASVIGYGPILGADGNPKRFRTQDAAALAAIKIWRARNE